MRLYNQDGLVEHRAIQPSMGIGAGSSKPSEHLGPPVLASIGARLDAAADIRHAYLYLQRAMSQVALGVEPRAVAGFLTYSPDVQMAAMAYYTMQHQADLTDLRERLGIIAPPHVTPAGVRAFRAERHALLARPRGAEPTPHVAKVLAQSRAMGWDKGKWVG